MRCSECSFDNQENSRFCSRCGTPLPSFQNLASLTDTKTLVTPISELVIGSVFANRYFVIEKLGQGGMGKVYRVLDKKLEEEIALKVLKPEIAVDKKTIERFRNELKLARRISHPHICRMYDLNEEHGTQFITMEYVPGEDLKSTIRRLGVLNVAKVIEIAKQICEGLGEAHRHDIVHRDLKTQNIMIDPKGKARIMDFGISRCLQAEGITADGIIVGTPEYISPEQLDGSKVDERSDLYSLGIILFEMATGQLPFKGDTTLSVAIKHKTAMPPDPRELNAQIPKSLSALILKCLEKRKDKRFKNAAEILEELEKMEKASGTQEKEIPRQMIGRKRFGKQVGWRLVLGIMILAGIIVAVGNLIFQKPSPGRLNPPVTQPKVVGGKIPPKISELPPQTGNLEMTSLPAGAEIYLDDQLKGKTPLKLTLDPGSYRIKVRKYPEYREIIDRIDIHAGESISRNFGLNPQYWLRIITLPSGAEVQIDNSSRGKTPLELGLSKNTVHLVLSKGEEWSGLDKTFDLKPGINIIQENLKKLRYLLAIKTEPAQAQIFLEGSSLGLSPLEKLVGPGVHHLRIEKDGFKTVEEAINVDSDFDQVFRLIKLQMVKVRFKVFPFANVFVDGVLIGEIPPIKTEEIAEGKHVIKFESLKLNKSYSIEVEIRSGENIEIRMNMETGESKIMKIEDSPSI